MTNWILFGVKRRGGILSQGKGPRWRTAPVLPLSPSGVDDGVQRFGAGFRAWLAAVKIARLSSFNTLSHDAI
jgi:hypothetical protein